jgi:hypothetical protein
MGKNGGNCPGGDVYYETYLYDLESDPLELNNLVRHREYGETREALSVIIKGYIDEIEARDVTILPSLISPGQYE